MCDDTHIDHGTHSAALQQIEALEAAVEQAQRSARTAQQGIDNWRAMRSTLLAAVNALAVETVENGDDDDLDTDAWRAILALDGVVDPRRVNVTITVEASRSSTAEVTITLTGVKRSEVNDIDVCIDDVTELGSARDWSAYVSVGVDYEDIEVEVDSDDWSAEVHSTDVNLLD